MLTLFTTFYSFGFSELTAYEPMNQNNKNFEETAPLKKIADMLDHNEQKFSHLREFNLPGSQYAITGSGALGIRNLREIGDIDIIVTPELWDILEHKFGVTEEGCIKKIVFPGGVIEAFGIHSYANKEEKDNCPSFLKRISTAEIIDGLPFERLEYVRYYKSQMGREKDLVDISLIDHYLNFIAPLEILVDSVPKLKEKS